MDLVHAGQRVKLQLVVGYDGTQPARRALERAAEELDGRPGHLEVVFVAHTPGTASMAPGALVELQASLDAEEHQLAEEAGELLRGRDIDWGFQRRDGSIAHELLAAATECLDPADDSSRVVLVVGASGGALARYFHSTPARIIRNDRFEVHVVP